MVFLFEFLSLIIQRVQHLVQVLESSKGVLKNLCRLSLLKNYQAIPSLVQGPINFLIKNHLTKFPQNFVCGKSDLFGHKVYLHLRIRLYDLFEVIFKKVIV